METFSVWFFASWYLQVTVNEQKIISALWQDKPTVALAQSSFALAVQQWLQQYFMGDQQYHNFPLQLPQSQFYARVYRVLKESSYGDTMSYASLAFKAGFPRAQRAVGSAMRRNSLAVFIPCHRVLACRGLGGYTPSLEIKRQLLALEAKQLRHNNLVG